MRDEPIMLSDLGNIEISEISVFWRQLMNIEQIIGDMGCETFRGQKASGGQGGCVKPVFGLCTHDDDDTFYFS